MKKRLTVSARCATTLKLLATILFMTFYVRLVDAELYSASERRIWLLVAAVVFDTATILTLCFLSPRRIRPFTTALVLVATWLLCMADVLSLRFYGSYFNMSLIKETQNLNGLGDSVMSLVAPVDYVVTAVFAAMSVMCIRDIRCQRPLELRRSLISAAVAVVAFFTPYAHEYARLYSTYDEMIANYNNEYAFDRSKYGFSRGIIKTACADLMFVDAHRATTDDDRRAMSEYERAASVMPNGVRFRNIIVIVIESLLSDVLQRGDAVAVVPNLRRLADNSFCHLGMVSTAGPGYSSDGQMMLMTGMMGHRAYISVNKFTDNRFPGLGHAARQCGMTMALIEPTEENYWHQRELCPQYGIDSLYYFDGWTTDEAVFDRAISVTECLKDRPFFLTVLTISMHMPYKKPFELALSQPHDADATADYLHYLSKCQYTDHHLGRYLDYLERAGIMDSTLLVVTSDHCPPLGELKYGSNNLSTDLPLIIKGLPHGARPDTQAVLHQQDLYPTFLDLLSATHPQYPHWRGVGYSIFDRTPQAERWPLQRQQEFSEMLLETDFLNNTGAD